MTEVTRILVTDDEEGMRLGVERALRKYVSSFHDLDCNVSYELDLASSGEEAVEKLTAGKYDILLLDYKLPEMNGIEVLGEAKNLHPDLLVVMMTAYASLDIAVSATKKGAFDFLAKPFTPQELRATIRYATKNLILQRQARKLAEEKRRVRFEFISVLSHELKAPIGAVEGYLELFRSGSIKDAETQERIIERSLARLTGMRKLIFDLLDLTRIEAGTKTRNLEEVSLGELVENALELVEVSARDRGISLHFSKEEKFRFVGDRSELEIVINNLVSNAVKYNRDNGEVFVRISKDAKRYQIEVEDTGIGMSEKELGKLFGEFVRMKNDKTRHIEGSGLGLSTVKKIVQLYNGDIRAISEWDKGTTFTVELPTDRA
ncbi:MAG: response regulator [Deltaproteobacteria bacterium]|nr:response regulator [Deltaproteobacteria bacterium]MBN2670502.1 response regulator [Deltaproteobacteria bacterium]